MISVIRASATHCSLLSNIGRQSFLESHGASAPEGVIDRYVEEKFSHDNILEELNCTRNIYHILFSNDRIAGYSKIILDSKHAKIPLDNTTKLERIYLLEEYYGSGSGLELFNFNLELSKENGQSGMWLFVWIENQRAINFYQKNGFKIIGSYMILDCQKHIQIPIISCSWSISPVTNVHALNS